jgi:hypothetical protein
MKLYTAKPGREMAEVAAVAAAAAADDADLAEEEEFHSVLAAVGEELHPIPLHDEVASMADYFLSDRSPSLLHIPIYTHRNPPLSPDKTEVLLLDGTSLLLERTALLLERTALLIEVRLKILTPQLPLAKVPFFIITKIVLIPGVPADRRSFPKSWEPIDWSVRILIKILFLKTTKIVRAATWPEKTPISRHLYLVVVKISPKEIGLKG